ncbi:50S ribosomal protein L24 [Gammaproteobacteria bacterium]|nr:50S ribosomal protein L24 [Gammaproteobacteria bacterium]
MKSKKFRLNDNVQVKVGKSKGKTGQIMKIDVQSGKVKIKDINLQTVFEKANPQENKPGQIRKVEGWIDLSNVAHFDTSASASFKVGRRENKAGKLVRFNKVTNKDLDEG